MARTFRWLCTVVAPLALLPGLVLAQEPATISGRVTDENGKPVASATVAIPGLGLGATTRENGQYSIVLPGARVQGQQVTLTARAISYKPQSATVTLTTGQTTQDFTLATNPLNLGEIVVTGAGTATEVEKLGNVRNSVTSEEILNSNESNPVQALAAKAPNVVVQQSGGDPGAGSYITIRGSRTVGLPNSGAGQPLFIVDGLPIDNSSFSTTDLNPTDAVGSGSIDGTTQTNRAADLNPNDIESVEILKGAAAAAIYGSRAGQGVILITTKKGKPGATKYTLRSSASLDNIAKTYPLQTTYGQGLNSIAVNDPVWGGCQGSNGPSNFACRTSWGAVIPAGTPKFDHADEAYVTGLTTENALTVSGGNDRTQFYLSGDYTRNRGVFVGPNNLYQRATVRLNAAHHLTDNLKVGGNFAYADTRGRLLQRGNNTNGLQLGLLRSPPDWDNRPYKTAEGLHQSFRFQNPSGPGDVVANRGWDNPFFVLLEAENSTNVGRVFGNVTTDYVPASWLKFNYTLGGDYSNDERLEGGAQQSSIPEVGGRITEGKVVTYQIDHNLTGTASYRLSQNLAGSVTLGQNLNSRNVRQLANVGRILIAPQPFKLDNTVSRDIPVDAETSIHGESYFGQATLDIFDQVFLTAALRNDGSSTFDSKHQRSWFPKASAAWTFIKQPSSERSILTYGKLRASYGEAGQEPDPYLTSTLFSGSALLGGYTQGMGSLPSQAGFGGLASSIVKGADSLKPERSKEFEAGFDLGLYKDKADLSFTYYHTITSDVILLTPLAPSSGFEREAKNSAKFRNAGAEVSLNLRPISTKDFSWDVGVQWGKNQSRVLDLGGPEFINLDPNSITTGVVTKGEEVGVFRSLGLVRCGISPNGMDAAVPGFDLAVVCQGHPTGAYFIGTNGEPVIDSKERIVGNPNPRWTGSLRTGLRFGKISVSGLLDIRHGGQVYNGTRAALLGYGTHKETEVRADCSGTLPGATVDQPCVGNMHVIGQPGSPLVGDVVGPGAGTPIPIGENWYAGTSSASASGIGGLFGGTDEQFMEPGGFVKLRELSVAFTLDQPWVQRSLGFTSIDLRAAGRNLHTWTDYTGYDPETNLGGAITATRGVDYFNMPQTRSFVFSVTLNR
jgi:TonB-linked SusC/RagA family outer membrane protein